MVTPNHIVQAGGCDGKQCNVSRETMQMGPERDDLFHVKQ